MGEPCVLLPVESAGAGVMGKPGRQQGRRLVAGKGVHFLRLAQPLSTGSPLPPAPGAASCLLTFRGLGPPPWPTAFLAPLEVQEVGGGAGPGVTQVWVGSSSSVFKVALGSRGLPPLHHPASAFSSENWERRPMGMRPAPVGGRILGG